MRYICEGCNFETDRLSHYENHLTTKKHLSNNEITGKQKNHGCVLCGAMFMFPSGLSRHKKICSEISKDTGNQQSSEIKTVIDLIKSNFEKSNEIMATMAKANVLNAETVSDATKAVVNATEANIVNAKTARKSMNMMTFAMRHFENAPPLRKLDKKEIAKSLQFFKHELKRLDYSKQNIDTNENNLKSESNSENRIFKKVPNDIDKIKNTSNKDSDYDSEFVDTDNEEETVDINDIQNIDKFKDPKEKCEYSSQHIIEYAEIILGHYRMKNLKSFVGEIIKYCRHKTNPNNNSMWETDISRLRFIVKYEGVAYNKSLWIKDECGDVIKTVVIINLCNDIKTILLEYVVEMNKKDNEFIKNGTNLLLVMKRKEDAIKIMRLVQKEDFHNKILKYIAPSFRFNDVMMEYYDNKNTENDYYECPSNYIYNLLKELFRKTNVLVYDNCFVELYFESHEKIVNVIMKYDDTIICIYYKHHDNKITVDEIKNIKKSSYKLMTDDVENAFSKKIKESIPMIIYNETPTQNELELLSKYKVKHVECNINKIKKYISSLFGI